MAAGDVAYLCDAANRYFRERIEAFDVMRTVSGANMVMNPGKRAAAAGRRDDVRPRARQGAADHDLRRRRHHLASARGKGGLEADAVLSDVAALDREDAAAGRRFCLEPLRERDRRGARALAVSRRGPGAASGRRLWHATSRRSSATPETAPTSARLLAPELTGAEVRYLMAQEWARFPDDILWRRTKLGLTMPPADRDALAAFMAQAGARVVTRGLVVTTPRHVWKACAPAVRR